MQIDLFMLKAESSAKEVRSSHIGSTFWLWLLIAGIVGFICFYQYKSYSWKQ
jgi:hypothetical protein